VHRVFSRSRGIGRLRPLSSVVFAARGGVAARPGAARIWSSCNRFHPIGCGRPRCRKCLEIGIASCLLRRKEVGKGGIMHRGGIAASAETIPAKQLFGHAV
jgi:hypothetical protein